MNWKEQVASIFFFFALLCDNVHFEQKQQLKYPECNKIFTFFCILFF